MPLIWNATTVNAAINAEFARRVARSVDLIRVNVVQEVPVLTGFLRSQISSSSSGLRGVVRSDGRYPGFVHEGFAPNGRRPPNPYFHRAILRSLNPVAHILGA